MSDTVIKVENIGKKYTISHQDGQSSYGTLRDQMSEGARFLGRQLTKPFSKEISGPTKEDFWALKDISFEVKQGDRLGLIGRNGAGKSTLLKILSRITEPTTGQITINGRVASLLEVGTGFHPELTGRENIFLNGAVLGMSRLEIQKKFDEIVDFAEVEKFLDTPVKRYSSGMYVRLAFAIAAHLEPEILIVDEVLAVGDIQFQKKCLGKMEEISEGEGRTILFVSHNIDTIRRLCSHCAVLQKGSLIAYEPTGLAIAKYLDNNLEKANPNQWIDLKGAKRSGTGDAFFETIRYVNRTTIDSNETRPEDSLDFEIIIRSESERNVSSLAISFCDEFGVLLVNMDTMQLGETIPLKRGENKLVVHLRSLNLKPGNYSLSLWLDQTGDSSGSDCLDYVENAFQIKVFSPVSERFGGETIGSVYCDFSVSSACVSL